MKAREKYKEVLDGLGTEEKKKVTEILDKTEYVGEKNREKKKWERFFRAVQKSLAYNIPEWLALTYAAAFVLMLFLAIHDIRCYATGDPHVLNSWFFYAVYLRKLHGHNIFYGLWQLLISAGVFTLRVYVFAWIYSALGLFVLGKIKTGNWTETRQTLFDYLYNREKYANMKGFNEETEREEMEKWATKNPNYHMYGAAINKSKPI